MCVIKTCGECCELLFKENVDGGHMQTKKKLLNQPFVKHFVIPVTSTIFSVCMVVQVIMRF